MLKINNLYDFLAKYCYDGLSKEIKEKMIAFLQELAKEKTIIVVTQDDDFIQKAHQHFHMINGLLETKK